MIIYFSFLFLLIFALCIIRDTYVSSRIHKAKIRRNIRGFPCGSAGKKSAHNAGDLGSRRSPGEGKGYPLQYSALENSMDCIVHGVAKSQIRLSSFRFLHFLGVWNLGEMTAKCGHTLDVGLDCE